MSLRRKLSVLVPAGLMTLGTSVAFAAAETYATDAATYISGDGKLTVLAVIAATASIAVIIWIARKLGMR